MLDSPRAVIFDFDYTLADSSDGVIACVNHALAGLGLPPESPARIRRTIGLSLAATLVELKGAALAHRADEFRRLFIACADVVMVERTMLYPWVPKVTATLTDRGIALGIVSTKYRRRIEAVLRREGLRSRFAVIVGGDDVAVPKPAPDALLLAVEMLGLRPRQLLYVGDSRADGMAARASDIPFVAVLSGVTSPQELERSAPIAMLGDGSELPTLLGLD